MRISIGYVFGQVGGVGTAEASARPAQKVQVPWRSGSTAAAEGAILLLVYDTLTRA